ncbi:alanine racemase [Microbacterium protaetiae]|uniref:Alanine racemase n=1 Tax=Microbacterium protaetiae TaxID=2509458 RepID=A0A4V0YDN3_9MICO|nr:alanine racemase [Microbacterium protaetiae]QAY61311.1 alanine racemase [Microbacterium protaetiae]
MSARVEVDLEKFAANLRRIRETVAPASHMLVVKDDAYGHGLPALVSRAVAEHVEWFGAFDVSTALEVRVHGGEGPRVLAWTVYDDSDIDAAMDASLELGIGDSALLARVIARARARGLSARVHLKIDTGLHRNGFRVEEWTQAVAQARDAAAAGLLRIVGVWSHIAEASESEDDAARAAFLDAAAALPEAPVMRHLAASAAAFARPEFRFDLVRIGAYAYGIRPEGGPPDAELGIRPIATLFGTVVQIDGEQAVLDVGSLDGLDSRLAGRLEVGTPEGPRALLAVTATAARVAGWPGARVGDDVALFGGRAPSSATDAAELVGTIGEQLVLRISPRLPRRYC